MASNSDGLWSESPATIKIHQQPFYYQTFAFWLLIALLVVFAFVIFVRIREKHMMEEQLRLETMVQMKTIDLEIEKDNSDRLLKNILPEPDVESVRFIIISDSISKSLSVKSF